MSDSVPTYQQVCALLDELNENYPQAREGFRSGVAYATMQVKNMDRRPANGESIGRANLGVQAARRDLEEALIHLPVSEADRVRDLIKILEEKVAERVKLEMNSRV